MSNNLIVPESIVYRTVGDMLVVIEIESGRLFYFSCSTKEILDFFKDASSLEQLFEYEAAKSGFDKTEEKALSEFVVLLKENNILVESGKNDSTDSRLASSPNGAYIKPELIRVGEKTLDEITLLD